MTYVWQVKGIKSLAWDQISVMSIVQAANHPGVKHHKTGAKLQVAKF